MGRNVAKLAMIGALLLDACAGSGVRALSMLVAGTLAPTPCRLLLDGVALGLPATARVLTLRELGESMPAKSPSTRKKRARTKDEDEENVDTGNQTTAPTFRDKNLQLVHDFLASQNRPFSLQNILDSLANKGDMKKAALDKALTELVTSEYVTCKEYGKAKLYLIRQKNIALPSAEETAALDSRLETLANELEELSAECQVLEAKISELSAQPRTEEAKERVALLETETATIDERIEKLQVHCAGYDSSRRQYIQQQHERALKALRLRRSRARQIILQMAEGMERKPRELADEIGIESDSDDWLTASRSVVSNARSKAAV
jgi:26S proteasome regulatory subunit (ATPase 3-interacting protein)